MAGDKRNERQPQIHFQHPDGFNPNAPCYKACCCHTKTFTIFTGIFEIFTLCFLLVAVLPDVTTRICDKLGNETDIEASREGELDFEKLRNATIVSGYLCHNNFTCLIWAIIQVAAVLVMFYGIKSIRYWLFIPHLMFRMICISLLSLVETWVVFKATGDHEDLAPYVTTIVTLAIILLMVLYATWMEIRCAHFTKRSHETGFSISIARPVGPATISLTDNPPLEPQDRPLPPLRHLAGRRNKNTYVTDETVEMPHPHQTIQN